MLSAGWLIAAGMIGAALVFAHGMWWLTERHTSRVRRRLSDVIAPVRAAT